MQVIKPGYIILAIFCCLGQSTAAQLGPAGQEEISVEAAFFENISGRSKKLSAKLDRHSQKAIKKFQNEEERIRRRLGRLDSAQAGAALAGLEKTYRQFEDRLTLPVKAPYIPKLDTLLTSLQFIDQQSALSNEAVAARDKLKEAFAQVKGLQSEFGKAESIKRFLKERRQLLKDQLSKFGLTRELKRLNKQAYYYSQRVNEYKEILKDSRKAERKALELLSRTKAFKDFMRKNSQLASLFRLPGNGDDPVSQASLEGLQTRAAVNQLLENQLLAGGPAAREQLQQNLQAAQAQLNELKAKVISAGGGNGAEDMPEDFQPNRQRTKSFWKKWELGLNVQSNRARGIMPVTSDLGVSAGFKPNEKFTAGFGFAGRIGWGRDIRHIAITYSGISVRSFAELKLKGSFRGVAAYEMNYRSEIREISQLEDYSAWQKSGLIGMSKTISMKSKVFKKMQILWMFDFLSYGQVPRGRPLIFRFGYQF